MNKLFTKIATAFVGVAMAVGVGVAIGNNSSVREARAEDVTGTIVFGSNDVKIDKASVTGDDDQDNTWTVTTVGTTSFTQNAAYSQVGSSSKPATSITLTTTLEESQTITAFSAKFGGFSGTAGTVTLKVGDTTVGSGSLNASSDVTVNNTNEGTGTILTVTVTGIAKGVKVYNVSYTYSSGGEDPEDATFDSIIAESDPDNLEYYSDATDADIDYSGAELKAHYISVSVPSWEKDVALDNEDVTWTINMSDLELTASFTDEDDVTKTYTWTVTDIGPRPQMVSWDLTTASYASATDDLVTWTSTYVNMSWVKNGGTKVNNYLPPDNAHSRIYTSNSVTIASNTGYAVTKIEITATGSSYIGGVANTWTYGDDDEVVASVSDEVATIDLDGDSTLSISRVVSATCRLTSVVVYYTTAAVVVPTKAEVAFKSEKGTVYNGSYQSTHKLLTSDVVVNTYDDDGNLANSYSAGVGFKLTVNSHELDATSAIQELSFTGVAAGQYTITVVVVGVGAGGTNVDNSGQTPLVKLTVVAKDVQSLAWSTEQKDTFVSYAEKLHVDGILSAQFNDGSTGISGLNVTTNIYTGTSAIELNKIYSKSLAKAVHEAGFDVTNADLLEGKSMTLDSENRLAYSSATYFYIEMYFTNYPSVKLGKTVSVVLPTLVASDANGINYYTGQSYLMAANAYLQYNSVNVRTLANNEISITPASISPTTTDPIVITVKFGENLNISGTYSITPQEPATLEEMTLFDDEGDAMTAESFVGFTAGDLFALRNKAGESYFAEVMDSDTNIYEIDSYTDFTFELLETSSSPSGTEITTSTYMRLSMNLKYIKATYSQGSSSISFTYQILVDTKAVSDITITTETGFVYNRITDTNDIESGAEYLIVCEANNEYLDGSLSDITGTNVADVEINTQTHTIIGNDDVDYATFTITSKTGGYSISSTLNDYYIGHTGSKNTMNQSNTDDFTITFSFDEDGNVDISCNGRVLRRNNSNFYDRFYGSGQTALQLYKQTTEEITVITGDKVAFLKSVIDAYRLNYDVDVAGEGISVCNAITNIYSSSDWTRAKIVYARLSSAEITQLSVQDAYGETGKTYVDTYEMLLAKEISNNGGGKISILGNVESTNNTIIIVVISVVSLSAIGGYFLLRKKKED